MIYHLYKKDEINGNEKIATCYITYNNLLNKPFLIKKVLMESKLPVILALIIYEIILVYILGSGNLATCYSTYNNLWNNTCLIKYVVMEN